LGPYNISISNTINLCFALCARGQVSYEEGHVADLVVRRSRWREITVPGSRNANLRLVIKIVVMGLRCHSDNEEHNQSLMGLR
jgi:hypothetical protein